MSRIGRMPISIPAGVEVNLDDNRVTVKGPKGELARELTPALRYIKEDSTLRVERPNDAKQARELHGLTRTLAYCLSYEEGIAFSHRDKPKLAPFVLDRVGIDLHAPGTPPPAFEDIDWWSSDRALCEATEREGRSKVTGTVRGTARAIRDMASVLR